MANEQEITVDDIQGHENTQPEPQKELKNDDDLLKICHLCEQLVNSVSDGKPGISQEDFAKLQAKRETFKNLVKYYRAGGQTGKNFSKAQLEMVESSGLKNSLTQKEAQISLKLASALIATFEYINTIDSNAYLTNEMPGDLNCAIKSNREFADFFIQTDKEMHFGTGLFTLFDKIFGNPNFKRELTSVGLGSCPVGTSSMIHAYLYLQKTMPEGSLGVSSLEQDRDSAIDLVWVKDGQEKRVFEVKGTQKVDELTLYYLKNPDHLASLRALNQNFDDKIRDSRNKSLENLLSYTQKNRDVEPWWIEIPTK